MRKTKSNNKFMSSCLLILCMAFAAIFVVMPTKASDKTVKTETIPSYSASGLETLIQEQEAAGYLYAGLFKSGTSVDILTKANAVATPTPGESYEAKFVPAGVMGIKAQVSGTLLKDETYSGSSIRMITAIDSLTYKEVGFSVVRKDAQTDLVKEGSITKYVYTELYAVDATDKSGKVETLKPSDIHKAATYFKTYTITGVPTEYYNTDLVVTPYWVTYDGVKVEGLESIKTVNLGRSWFYVDATATSSAELGTYDDPYKTIQKAVAHETELVPQVILKNDIEVISKVDIPKSLTLRSEDAERSASESNTLTANITRASSLASMEDTDGMFDLSAGTVIFKDLAIKGNAGTSAEAVRGIHVGGNVTLNATDVTVTNFNSTIEGAAIRVSSAGTMNLTNGTISNNTTTDTVGAGAIHVSATGSVNLVDSNITGNSASAAAGGAILTYGKVTMTGGTISTNTSAKNAGAVFVHANGDFILNSGTVEGNTAGGNGGAIYAHFNNNEANVGGVHQGAAVVTINGGTISNNTENGTDGGGAIYVVKGSSMTMTGGTISGNTANGEKGGGAIFLAGTLEMSGGTIDNNTTPYYGGGINIRDTGSMTMLAGTTEATISNNKSTKDAGGIYVAAGGQLDIQDGTISTNTAGAAGGAILTYGPVTMSGGTISGNTSKTNGGAIFIHYCGTFTMSGGEVSGNTASGTTVGNGLGGGFYVHRNDSGRGKLTIEDGTISGNQANGEGGGGIGVAGGGILEVKGGTITKNSAKAGGGVFLFYSNVADSATMTMTGGTISNNTSGETGAGIFVHANAECEIAGGYITGNTATTNGGAIYVHNNTKSYGSGKHKGYGVLTMSDGTISGNTANGGTGGGAIVLAGTSFTMTGGTIDNNKATAGAGGGIRMSGTTANMTMTGGTISNNVAYTTSGAIHVTASCTLDLQDGTISGNSTTTDAGGAILNYGTITMSGGKITGNTAKARGGAIFMHQNSTLTMSGGEISGNTAGGNGGAIFLHSNTTGHGSMTMTAGTISNNTSNGADGGGAIGIAQGADATIQGGTISGNKAAAGGAVLTWGTAKMSGGTLSGNEVTGRGGAVFVHITGTFDMSNGTITGNTSASHGGGVCLHRNANGAASMTMTGGTITKNTAGGNGGGIVAISAENKLHIAGGSVTGNSLSGTGVGPQIFAPGTVTSEKTLTIGGKTVNNYVIVASSTTNAAAVYLQEQIKNLTGYTLSIVTSSSSANQIIIQSGGTGQSSGLSALQFKLYLTGTKLYVCAGTTGQEIIAAKMLYTKYMSADSVEDFSTSTNPTISSLNFKFTCDWDAFTKTPSVLHAKSMHFDVADNHKVMQGACTDGTYAYYIMNNQDAGEGAEDQWTSYIYKVNLSTKAVTKVSAALPLGHANSMTYNSATKKLVVVIYEPDPYGVQIVDASTLAMEDVVDLGRNLINIAYNPSTGTYAVGRRAADYLRYYEYLDDLSDYDGTYTASSSITMQAKQELEYYDNRLFWLYAWDENAAYQNTIYVTGWGGSSIQHTIKPGLNMEIENLFFYQNIGYTGYVIPGSLGGLVCETIFYQQL